MHICVYFRAQHSLPPAILKFSVFWLAGDLPRWLESFSAWLECLAGLLESFLFGWNLFLAGWISFLAGWSLFLAGRSLSGWLECLSGPLEYLFPGWLEAPFFHLLCIVFSRLLVLSLISDCLLESLKGS